MPVVLAFLASLSIHVTVLLSDGWALPSFSEPEELDVVLVPPATMQTLPALPAPTPTPAPVAKPPKKSAPRPPVPATPTTPDAPVMSPAVSTAAAPEPPSAPAVEPKPVEPAPAIKSPPMPPGRLANKGRLRYDILRGEGGLLIGQAVHSWEHDGEHYSANAVTETIGIAALIAPGKVIQESRGQIDAYGLKPEHFRHEQRKRTDEATIDRERGIVRNGERDAPLGGQADLLQDTLSMYYQLTLLLSGQTAVTGEINLPIVTGRRLETYRFELLGEENLSYRLTSFPTRHVRTRNREDIIDLWITPKLPLPLRIRFVDRKGDIYDQWMDITPEGLPK